MRGVWVGVGVRVKEPHLSPSLFFPALYLRAAWNRLGFRVRLGRCCVELHHGTVLTQFPHFPHNLDWLSLDPIDRSPFGHLMKFTQRSFPLYVLGLSTAFTDEG